MLNEKKYLIISGVTKAGTTSLFTYLNKHENITGSSIKETCFFLPLRYSETHKDVSEYGEYFDYSEGSEYFLEATPGYFYGGKRIAKTIHQKLPNAKIILILRNPTERFISFYKYVKGLGIIPQTETIEQYLKKSLKVSENRDYQNEKEYPYFGYQDGLYDEYLRSWLTEFGSDEITVLYFEDFVNNTIRNMKEIASFLNINEDIFNDPSLYTVENKSIAVSNRRLHKVALSLNQKLEKFLRRKPILKEKLRGIYFFLNEREFEESIDNDFKNKLFSLYRKSVYESEKILEEYNYQNPRWSEMNSMVYKNM